MKKNTLIFLIVLIVFVWVLPGYRESMDIIAGFTPAMTMVIDAGHGGQDSGACAKDGTKEKSITLSIAKFLQKEAAGYRVSAVMTREGDDGLYDDYSTASGWTKVGDMKARRMIMDDSKPQLVVSIHLNSFFSDESVHGAQIFYPTNGSPETVAKNETLARTVKELLRTELPNAGDRIILPKKDMFIFREAAFDGLLVECGFLSNPDDLNMLKDEEYQKSFAAALMKGIAANYNLKKL